MATRDEKIRFIAEIEGRKDVEGMGKAFDVVGKAAEQADPAAKKLVDDLERIGKDKSAVQAFVKLKAEVAETGPKLAAAKAELERLRGEMNKTGDASKGLQKSYNAAEKEVEKLTKAENRQSVELAKLGGQLQKAGIDTNKLTDADRRLAEEGQKVAQRMREFAALATAAGKGAKDAAAGVDELAKKQKEAQGAGDGLLGSLGKISVLAAALGVALKGLQIGTDAFAGAANIEESLARVRAVASGATEDFAKLGSAVQDASREAKVGPEVAAQALSALAAQGQNVNDAITSLVPTLLLAKNANIEVGQSAGYVDDVLDLFGLSAEDAGRAVDVLTAASKGSDEGLAGLLGAMSKLAPTAREAGLSFEETTGILGVFAQNGFSSEKAAKGLLKIFDDLRDPTSQLRDDLGDLGDNSGDFTKAIETLSGAGDKGKKALDNLDASSRNLVLFLIQQGGDAISKFQKSLQGVEGTASSTAKAIDDNLKGAFGNVTEAFDRLATSFLTPILTPLKDEIEKVGIAFDDFAKTEAFAKLQGALLTFVQTGLAALGEFFKAIDFDKLGTNLANFGTNASAFFTEFRTDLEEVARFTGNTLNAIGVLFDGAAAVIHGAAGTIAASLGGIVKVGALLAEVQIGDKLVSGLTGATSAAEKLNQVSQILFDSASTNFDQTGTSLSSLKTNLDQLLAGLDATKPAAEGTGTAIATIGTAAESLPEKTAGAVATIDAIGLAGVRAAAGAVAAASAVGGIAVAVEAANGPLEAAKQRLAQASEALVALQKSAEATPEALAAASAEFQAATFQVQKLTGATKDGKAATEELTKAYKDLGIVSQSDLIDKAKKAADGFDAVTRAQQRGAATAEDVRRAFVAMAEAQLAVVRDSDATTRARVENELRVKAATLGVVEALDKLGLAGKKAGEEVAAGANQAADSLDDTAAAADKAADSAGKLGTKADDAAAGLQNVANASQQAAGFAIEASEAFADAAGNVLGLDRTTFNVLEGQKRAFEEELRIAREGNLVFDERAQILSQLRNQYGFISEAQLQLLANEKLQLQQNQERKRQEQQQKREQQQSNSGGSSGGGASVPSRIQIEVTGRAIDTDALTKDSQALGKLVRAIAPELERLAARGGFNLGRR